VGEARTRHRRRIRANRERSRMSSHITPLLERTGYDEDALAELPVLDPAATVRADVERVLSDPRISPRITVSGHVYDLDAGLITTIVRPTSPMASAAGLLR